MGAKNRGASNPVPFSSFQTHSPNDSNASRPTEGKTKGEDSLSSNLQRPISRAFRLVWLCLLSRATRQEAPGSGSGSPQRKVSTCAGGTAGFQLPGFQHLVLGDLRLLWGIWPIPVLPRVGVSGRVGRKPVPTRHQTHRGRECEQPDLGGSVGTPHLPRSRLLPPRLLVPQTQG